MAYLLKTIIQIRDHASAAAMAPGGPDRFEHGNDAIVLSAGRRARVPPARKVSRRHAQDSDASTEGGGARETPGERTAG